MGKHPLSSAEETQIRQEIKAIIQTLITGCENLDMAMAFGMFLDSPEFLMMGTDGSTCDYQTYLQNNIEYLQTCTSFKLTTYGEEIRVLDAETAVYAWAYGVEAAFKNGGKDIVECAGASFVFKRGADQAWKVVYYHESSVPPIQVT